MRGPTAVPAGSVGADNQDSSHDENTLQRSQAQGTSSAVHQPVCQPKGKPDNAMSQGSCIVDLKPGDVRLFEPSKPTTAKLGRWLDLQAASTATDYVFVKNGRGLTTANQRQYQVAVRGRFKFDAQGRFSLNEGLYTGTTLSPDPIIPGWD